VFGPQANRISVRVNYGGEVCRLIAVGLKLVDGAILPPQGCDAVIAVPRKVGIVVLIRVPFAWGLNGNWFPSGVTRVIGPPPVTKGNVSRYLTVVKAGSNSERAVSSRYRSHNSVNRSPAAWPVHPNIGRFDDIDTRKKMMGCPAVAGQKHVAPGPQPQVGLFIIGGGGGIGPCHSK
jgi:hypothetical protein